LNAAALDLFARRRVEAWLSWSRRRLLRIAAAFAVLAAGWLVLSFAGPEHGLRGRFYPRLDGEGLPASTRIDRIINFPKSVLEERAGDEARLRAVWEGFVFAPKRSTYAFALRTDGEARVMVGGEIVADFGGAPSPGRAEGRIDLDRGSHPLRVEYRDAGGEAGIDFRWRETETPRWRMPRLFLYPRPVNLGTFIWDTIRRQLKSFVKAAALAAAVLLLAGLCRAARPGWGTIPVLALAGFAVMAVLYGSEVLAKRSTAVSGCDPFAYLQAAELMARQGLFRTEYTDPLAAEVIRTYEARPGPEQLTFIFAPLGYYLFDFDQGLVYNVFPPGLPLFLLPVVRLLGRAPVFWLLPALNAAVLVFLFALGTRAAGAAFGLVLAAVTVFNYPAFENTVVVMSDHPSLALLGLSALLVERGFRSPRLWILFLAGGIFGAAVLVRYSNLVAAVPLAALFFWKGRENPGRFASALGAFSAAALLAGALPLALYTHRLFGTPFRLVYEPFSQSRMAWENLGPGAAYYGRSLFRTFGLLTLLAALVGAGSGFFRPRRRPAVVVCLVGLSAFFVFFAFHGIRNERYLLPAYPLLGGLAALGMKEILTRLDRSFLASALILAVLGSGPLLRSRDGFRAGERRAEVVSAALAAKLPAEAVVFCEEISGALRFYAGLTGYRFLPAEDAVLVETASILTAKGRPVYFYLDSPAAEARFLELSGRNEAFQTALRGRGRVRGRPLFEFSPQTPDNGPSR